MPSPESLLGIRMGSVVAPAGHGKTELIAKVAALGRRTLVLTHTHAGVHALRARLKRLGVDPKAAAIDTIASWSSRYASAFPRSGRPLGRMPKGGEWSDVYKGGTDVLGVSAVRAVVDASYDRILVDEYQDCDLHQHALVIALSEQLPTIVFGDRMQGIFGFRGNPSISWDRDVFPRFPQMGTLMEPMRWRTTNPALGEWISHVRGQLERGESIDLTGGPATFVPCDNAYDLSPLFHDVDVGTGSVAAIHCRRDTCDQLAKSSRGLYQAIEDIACKSLQAFADGWDSSSSPERVGLLRALVKSAITAKPLADGEMDADEDLRELAGVRSAYHNLGLTGEARFAVEVIEGVRRYSRARTFRAELMRDTTKALIGVVEGKYSTLAQSAFVVRQRVSHGGRYLPRRTVSTPLLLKGLEFEHVVVPDASHFYGESDPGAQAKLFYVAVSRARASLVLASSSASVQFPVPADH